MAKSRGNTCRILRVLLKLFAAACFLNLAGEPVFIAATDLDKTTTKCVSKDGIIICNRQNLTDVNVFIDLDVKSITNFSAAFNKLTRVPRVLLEAAANLVMLDLAHNDISYFDASDFQEMNKLENLDLSFNQLIEINLTGEVLSSLRTLNLSNNGLRTLNINATTIKNLRTLNLNNNNLKNNLHFFQDLPRINNLYLEFNRISNIERCVSGESYLHTLSLRGNLLTNVSFLNSCTYLHYLDLSNNDISVISDAWTNKLTIISYLSIANNSIENADFLRHILVSKALIHVDISHNKIKHIDHSRIEAKNVSKKIMHVDVSYNELDDLSFIIKIKSINTLIADNNNISFIATPFSLPQMRQLSLGNNNLSNLTFLTNLPNLEYVDLSYNRIDDIEVDMKNILKLSYLDLSNNRLSRFELLQNSPNLNVLNISNNNFKKLPCNTYLKSLYIDGNDINDLTIKCMPHLRLLSVFGTVIRNKYSIPLNEANSISFHIQNQHGIECIPTKRAVMACSKACDVSDLNEIFCPKVVNTTSTSIYIGLSVGVIALFLLLFLIRYRWRMKRSLRNKCTCHKPIEESRH